MNHGKIVLDGDVIVRSSCRLYAHKANSRIVLHKGVEVGEHSTIACVNCVEIGDNVLFGPHVFISDHNHEYENPNVAVCRQGERCKSSDRVYIGNDSWIDTNAVIVGNVSIGKHCVIGANSVVTKDIPDYSIAVGLPAKVIKQYDFEKKEWVKCNKQHHA